MTLDDLERPKRHSCRNKKSFMEPIRKIDLWTWTHVYYYLLLRFVWNKSNGIIGRSRQFETKLADEHLAYCNTYQRCKIITYSRSPWLFTWFWSCAVIFGYRRDFLSCFTAVKISVLCVISAFERSLMYTRKPCCGRETARCRCKIRYVSKFIAKSRFSLW